MDIIIQEGDYIPDDGFIVVDLRTARKHTDSCGRVMYSCLGCNELAEGKTEDRFTSKWAADPQGIIVRRSE